MRIPQQVTERVKEAPAQALRAVFSGIGQVLLVADRMKHRAAEPDRARSARTGPAAQPRPAAPVVRDETRWRSLDTTGNVRLLNEEDTAKTGPAVAGTPPAAEATAAPTAQPKLAAETSEATEPAAAAGPPAAVEAVAAGQAGPAEPEDPGLAVIGQSSLPVPNYDNLTIASLRARLRGLDRSQVQLLHDYEKANAGRADVLTMFERRIVKLDSGRA
jgi:hypothetical protein